MKHLLPILLLLLLLPAPLVAQEPVVPTAPPAAETGRDIFENRCATCHGERGGGDGPLSANLQIPPAAFADPAYRQTAVPATLFDTITNGRLARLMPPFGPSSSDTIAEADRWNLIATIFSLSTPPAAIDRGAIIYQESCVACHGDDGRGSGSAAANAPTDLTNLDYWFSRSNEMVLGGMGSVTAHAYTLDAQALWDVVDYSRTFSYGYADLFPPLKPIAAATISGQVVNGTTNETITGLEASLRAFTTELDEALTLTALVGENGRFSFDLTLIPPDWVYIVSTEYNGVRFSSEVSQLNPDQPTLELPIIVYDATSDASVVGIDRVHLITEFVNDTIRVNELYIFTNRAAALFNGATGDPTQGTVQVVLPAGAQNVVFQRAFQSLNSFVPASEMIQTEAGWADTLPLRPGRGSLNLLVQYDLPYEAGLTLAHPLFYDANQISLSLPDVGVAVAEGEWLAQGAESLPTGTFLTYVRPGLAADEALNVTINGRPRFVTDGQGNNLLVRDETTELVVGIVALLLALAGAGWLLWRWRQAATTPPPTTPDALLATLAALDDAHTAGTLTETAYQRQRTDLKDQLHQLWD